MQLPYTYTYTHVIHKLSSFCLLLVVSVLLAACGTTSGQNHPATNSAGKTANTASAQGTPATGQSLSPGAQPIVYVAMGASDAVGVGSTQPGSQGYVPLLAQHLPQGSHVVNLGVSGIRLHEALQKELPIALSIGPRLITIWLVANDFIGGVSYESYMQDLDTMLKQLHTGTQAKLVMANLPDLTLVPAFSQASVAKKDQMRGAIQHWNARISALATRYDVTLVDLYSHNSQLTAHPEYISKDGFHPSPAGYVQLANFFWAAMNGQQ